MKYCSIYEYDRAYGGPEEGGWYYDMMKHVASFPRRVNSHNRERYFTAIERLAGIMNHREGRYPASSVLSNGEYVGVIEKTIGECTTSTAKPYYE